jgi:two-component system, NarL family, response regulator NreC
MLVRSGSGCPVGVLERQAVVGRTRILVVDDHGIVREGVSAILDRESGMKVVGTAESGLEALKLAIRLKPDVITMEMHLPDGSGIDAAVPILASVPRSRIVVLSECHTSEHVYRAWRAGVRGYVWKGDTGVELIHAIQAVVSGGHYLSEGVCNTPLHRLLETRPSRSPVDLLSDRERQVLHLTVSGSSSATTARLLNLSPKTVDTYRSRVMNKLGVSSLPELVRFCISNGITMT